jgi:hypothetical protein
MISLLYFLIDQPIHVQNLDRFTIGGCSYSVNHSKYKVIELNLDSIGQAIYERYKKKALVSALGLEPIRDALFRCHHSR